MRRCAQLSAVRWLSWLEVTGVSLRRPKQDEFRHGPDGLVLSSAPRPEVTARRRLAGANVLRHAVELYGGHTEFHAMTLARIIAVSIRWSTLEGLEGALPQ